jgi:hypothetical protein
MAAWAFMQAVIEHDDDKTLDLRNVPDLDLGLVSVAILLLERVAHDIGSTPIECLTLMQARAIRMHGDAA